MMRSGFRALSALLVLSLAGTVVRADDVKDAIVKIYTIVNTPDYYNPWSMRGTGAGTGSGAILKGRKILTNAHVVGNQTFIQVRRYGEAQRYTACVLSVSHEADLAVLTVEDPEFFNRGTALELGELPDAQEEVLVYGFPLGGDTLSITKGVISRIEHQTYSHSSASLLAGQIDAAINPGNSGGPVLIDGRIVGVVMQGMSQADNIGYMVPADVVRHFFRDLEDGRRDGFPSLGVVLQDMENPDLKRNFLMPEGQTGTLVTHVLPGSAAEGNLRAGDVILSLDGHPVADDGTVEFRPRQRTSLAYWVQQRQVGEPFSLEILRSGSRQTLNLDLRRPAVLDPLVVSEQYDVLPSYYIYGGLVFCPLTKNLLRAWGPNWFANAPNHLMAYLAYNVPEVEGEQVVLGLKVLAADVNQGYHGMSNWVVETVDGQRVRNLMELIAAVEKGAGNEFITFGDKNGQVVVLDRRKAEAAHEGILNTYRIPADRSPDLKI
jgi:S1-C subfamily serine protease